jgi:PHD/YefM family antitoxin component YafN of YafNO toxin-antitoxin module
MNAIGEISQLKLSQTSIESLIMNPTQEQYVIDASGAKTAVILSIEQYEQLLEDLHDLAIVAERRSEQAISAADLKKRLERDGTV